MTHTWYVRHGIEWMNIWLLSTKHDGELINVSYKRTLNIVRLVYWVAAVELERLGASIVEFPKGMLISFNDTESFIFLVYTYPTNKKFFFEISNGLN